MLTRYIKEISFFGGASVIKIMLPVILIPILALSFSPGDYRVLSIFQMTIVFFSIFIGLQSQSSVLRYVKNNDRYLESDRSMLWSSMYIFYRSIFILLIVFITVQSALSDFLKISVEFLWMSFSVASLHFLWNVYLNYCQAKERGKAYFVSTLSYAILSLFITIAFIYIDMEWNERVLAIVVTAIIVGLTSYFKLGKAPENTNINDVKVNLKYGIGIIPHAAFIFFLGYLDKLYVNASLSASEAGSYFLMFQVSQICLLIPTAFNKVYVPWLFNNASDTKKMQGVFTKKKINFSILSVIFVCALTGFVGYVILLFLAKENNYAISENVYIILCLIATINALYLFAINFLHFLEDTKKISIITFFSVVITVASLIYLVPIFGAIGAATSALLGSIARLLLVYFVGMRAFRKYHSDYI